MPKLERTGWIVIRVIKEDNENDIIERTRTARVVPRLASETVVTAE